MRMSRPRPGFTLVELLVVIGIIALLIGILLPSHSRAQDQARCIECLSNLKQLGLAHGRYVNENNGFIIPSDYRDMAAAQTANGWPTSDSWATIMVTSNLVPYPPATDVSPPVEKNVFQCPNGVIEFMTSTNITNGQPTSRQDGQGLMGIKYTSKVFEPGRVVYSWYGINGTSNGDTYSYIPCKRFPPDGKKYGTLTKTNQIKKPSELAFLFDGLGGINYYSVNANRITARHNRQRQTNVLFFDGHAETFQTSGLPGGLGNANAQGASTVFGLPNLKNYDMPKWRMDQ